MAIPETSPEKSEASGQKKEQSLRLVSGSPEEKKKSQEREQERVIRVRPTAKPIKANSTEPQFEDSVGFVLTTKPGNC